MAVAQSRFEASVNALPWINVMCGISQVAAGLVQWQRQAARKQPRAFHSYRRKWRWGGEFYIGKLESDVLMPHIS